MATRQDALVGPTSAAAVRRTLREELDQVLARLPPDAVPAAGDVHEIRKALKRARAMLRLLRPGLDRDTYERGDEALRAAGKRLAAARDAQVMADLYATLARSTQTSVARTRRGSSKGPTSPAVSASVADATAARSDIRAARDRVNRAQLTTSGWTTLGTGFRKVYRLARRRMPREDEPVTVASLHAWRRATKRHWHALELFQPVRPRRIGAVIRDAHQLSDLLGEDHDLALLSRVIAARRRAPQPADARVLRAIGPRRKELQVEALEVGERLYAARPRQVEKALRHDWERWRRRERPTRSRLPRSQERRR
jgi:CHAD domain-containing protein